MEKEGAEMEAAAKISEEAYLEAERKSETKNEFVNGMIVAMAGTTYVHNLIVSNLSVALNIGLRGRCRAVTSDQRVHVPATGLYTYPDVVVVCGAPEFHPKDRMTLLNPRMLVEVLSPSTEAYDRGAKFRHYAYIDSLMDYVMVSQETKRVEHYRRLDTGQWLLTAYEGAEAVLVMEDLGLYIPLSEIYEGVDEVPGYGEGI